MTSLDEAHEIIGDLWERATSRSPELSDAYEAVFVAAASQDESVSFVRECIENALLLLLALRARSDADGDLRAVRDTIRALNLCRKYAPRA